MQRLDFEDAAFLRQLAQAATPAVAVLIEKMLSGEEIQCAGVWGHWQQRFSKTQILQEIDRAYPKESEVA